MIHTSCDLLGLAARPIISDALDQHLARHQVRAVDLAEYARVWCQWLTNSQDKNLYGLGDFTYADFCHGTSQAFDHFMLQHAHTRRLVWFRGEFLYHACCAKWFRGQVLDHAGQLAAGDALIISLPFSGTGCQHRDLANILGVSNRLEIPVCLDLAYWGIAKNISLDLASYPCVKQLVSSLSKPFGVLQNHRIGVRFTREYQDDGISMMNEVGMQNFYSMSLGVHFMHRFGCDWNWQTHGRDYHGICQVLDLAETDTVIFALGDHERHAHANRGIPDTYRLCVSAYLTTTGENQ